MGKLRFVFGPSGSGKSTAIYEELLQRAAREPERNFLVIVPDQYTMQTQAQLVKMSPVGGILNIDVLSFGRLTHRVLEEVGTEELPVLDDTGKSLILQKVAASMTEDLPTLGRRMQVQGYIHQVKSAISEFMQYGIAPDGVDKLLECAGSRGALKAKLRDLQTLYRGFMSYLEGHFITKEEKLDVLRESLPGSELIPDAVLVFDGFTGFTPIQLRVIGDLLERSGELILTLALGAGEDPFAPCAPEDLFYLTHKTVASCLKLCEETGAERGEDLFVDRPRSNPWMQHLERQLFRFPTEKYAALPEGLHLAEMSDPREEAHQVALEIHRLTHEEGYAYREIAVVSGDLEGYAPYLEREMERLEIPIYMDRTSGVAMNPLLELTESVLEIPQEGYSIPSVVRYLRSGLAGFTPEEADLLENYIRGAGIRGRKKWELAFTPETAGKRVKVTDADLETLNLLRTRFLEQVSVFDRKKRKASEFVELLCDYLEQRGVEEQLYALEQRFHEEGDAAREREYAQIYGLVLDLLDQIHALLGEEVISPEDFSMILTAGYGEIRVGTIPRSVDRVLIGDMERTRLSSVRVLFFLGINDGNIPQSSSGGGLLSELDREFLQEAGMELAPTPRQQMYTQRLYLYLNMTKPSEKLYLSYANLGIDGKSMRPSYLVDVLRGMFPQLSPEYPERRSVLDQIRTPREGMRYLAAELREYVASAGEELPQHAKERQQERKAQLFTLYQAYEHAQPERRERLREAAFRRFVAAPLDPELTARVFGTELSLSVSRMETYADCPYRFFLQYGMKLIEESEYEVSRLDRGTLSHNVLERFGQRLAETGETWRTFTESFLDRELPGLLEQEAVRYGGAIYYDTERSSYELQRMERVLKKSILILQYQIRQGAFDPVGYELPFHREIAIDVPGSSGSAADTALRRIHLNGRIDRLDLAEWEDKIYVKILDYKSSRHDLDLAGIYEGLKLQLPLYMGQELEALGKVRQGKEIRPGAMLYFQIRDPLIEDKGKESAPEEILEKQRKEQRPRGYILGEDTAYLLLDRELGTTVSHSNVIPVDLNKNGSLAATTKSLLSEEDMETVIDYSRDLSERFAQDIYQGQIPLQPRLLDQKKLSCGYCPYRASCPFDPDLEGCRVKETVKLEPAEYLDKMRDELRDKPGRQSPEEASEKE